MKYYCIKQNEIKDCGVACIATICKQNGYNISITKVREITGTDRYGTSVLGLVKAGQKLGFDVKAYKTENRILPNLPLPLIAHVILDNGFYHYVVIHKITRMHIVIADPLKGIIKVPKETFFSERDTKKNGYTWTGILISFKLESKEMMSVFKKKNIASVILYFIKIEKNLIILIFVSSLLLTIIGIFSTFYYSYLIDEILYLNLKKTLMGISIGIIILNVFRGLLSYIRSNFLLFLSRRIDASILFKYYTHLVNLPLNFFESRNLGDIISRFQDASSIREAISGFVLSFFIDIIMVIIVAIFLFIKRKELFFITLFILLFYGIIVYIFKNKYNALNHTMMKENANLNSFVIESVRSILTIKVENGEKQSENNMEEKLASVLNKSFELSQLEYTQNSLKFIVESIGTTVILWIGSLLILDSKMSVGELISYNFLVSFFIEPIKSMINLQPSIQKAKVAFERINEIFEIKTEVIEQTNVFDIEKIETITFKNVTFGYSIRSTVLENINLQINKGERIALVGRSGSGKTTIVRLLLRLYNPTYGEIYLNGINSLDINLSFLRENIEYISQDSMIFNDTLYSNLMYGNLYKDINSNEIMDIIKSLEMEEFINSLSQRFNTVIEENGENLSSGQKQKILLVRALLKKPNVLIMDEAMSNLDLISEKAIYATLDKMYSDLTIIHITHKIKKIQNYDKIYVVEKGGIVQCGKHIDLKNHGKYKEMLEME